MLRLFQSSLQLWSTVLNVFFPDITSAIPHLHVCTMADLWITEYSGFMKNFVSSMMKNIHPSDIFSIETDLFLFKLAIYEFLSVKFKRNCSKRICKYLNINAPWKIFLVYSWTQVRSVFNGIETIARLGPKIWDLVFSEINSLNAKVTIIYRNQSNDFQSKSIDWLLYDGNFGV